MVATSRWKATYTKRAAKKKKYLDGFVLVRSNKMILLDANDKPVDEMFIGKNVVVEAGCELTFDHYLVEVDCLEPKSSAPGVRDADTPADVPPSKKQKVSSFPARPAFKRSSSSRQQEEVDDGCVVVSTSTFSPSVTDSINQRFNSARSFKVERNVPVQFRFSIPNGPAKRKVVVPDKFRDLIEYKTIMSEALVEEISFIVAAFASRFKAAEEKVCARRSYATQIVKGSSCTHSQFNLRQSEGELERLYCSRDINFFGCCELVKRSLKPGYITIRMGRASEPLNYSKGDLMVISSSVKFPETNSSEFTVLATSESYGSSKQSLAEFRLHGEPVPRTEGRVYILQGPNIQSELMMLDCVRKIELSKTPLLPLLLGSETYVPKNLALSGDMASAVRSAALKYKLNKDQEAVLLTVTKWFSDERNEDPHVCLVHGPFGSGKSHLLVVLIIFFSEVLKDPKARFIVACATNSAVDRVLMGLLELGFQDFLRVGSLSKIASKILPYSIHAKGGGKDEAEEDLKQLLKETYGSERLKIENELKALRDGRMLSRRKKLQKVRVVGVTCSSTINEALQGNTFKVCLLDECSQILEPLSLLPISQFRCQRLIAVGDPEQLPPVLCQAATKEQECDTNRNLSRTLFVRLAALGHKPVLLRTQYRCHPRLASVPNRLFYGGELLDGCSEVDRAPLLSGLEPLVFCDTCKEGKESRDPAGSYSNPYEAKVICDIVEILIAKGVSAERVGVIALYKAQELLIRQTLFPDNSEANRKTKRTVVERDVKVSTVDAFQGLEKDIVIISCCRTSGLGFLSSRHRLNVALTRAKHHLLVIGSALNLQRSSLWEELLQHVRRNTSTFKCVEEMRMELADAHYISRDGSNSDLPVESRDEAEMSDLDSETKSQLSPSTLLGKIPSVENLDLLFQSAAENTVCCSEMEEVLHAVDFGPRDFWEGYKLYCIGYYSHSFEHQDSFSKTLMADVIRKVHKRDEFEWGKNFDELVRSSWCEMEEYVKKRHEVNCGDIRLLIENYDDINELTASEHGLYFLGLCKLQDETDETGPLARIDSQRSLPDGNIVDSIMNRLNSMDERLEKLRRTSNG